MSLEKSVRVASRFQRSVRIDTDFESLTALDGFRCTWSFARALKTLAENLSENSQGAFTWTGPYGGGKSALALALCHIVGPRGKIRKAAEEAVGSQVGHAVTRGFPTRAKGLAGPTRGGLTGARTRSSLGSVKSSTPNPSKR